MAGLGRRGVWGRIGGEKGMSKTPSIVVQRFLSSVSLRTEIEAMTDGELASDLIKEVWSQARLWTREGILIDEAISRLRRADIQRRWNKRRTRRASR